VKITGKMNTETRCAKGRMRAYFISSAWT